MCCAESKDGSKVENYFLELMEEEKRPLGDFVSIFAFEMFYFKYSTRDNFFIIFEDFETNKNNQNDEILITTI